MEKLITAIEFALAMHGQGFDRPESRAYLCEWVNGYWCNSAGALPPLLHNASVSRFLKAEGTADYAWRLILAAPFTHYPAAARAFTFEEMGALANGFLQPEFPATPLSVPDAIRRHMLSHRHSLEELQRQAETLGMPPGDFLAIARGLKPVSKEDQDLLKYVLRSPERSFYTSAEIAQMSKWEFHPRL
jgi:hypothetical protein